MSDDKIARGVAAEQLLGSQLLKQTFDALDGEYHRLWRTAKTVEAREDLHRYVKVLERIIEDLQDIAQTGKLEQARIKELEGGKKGFTWPTIS